MVYLFGLVCQGLKFRASPCRIGAYDFSIYRRALCHPGFFQVYKKAIRGQKPPMNCMIAQSFRSGNQILQQYSRSRRLLRPPQNFQSERLQAELLVYIANLQPIGLVQAGL